MINNTSLFLAILVLGVFGHSSSNCDLIEWVQRPALEIPIAQSVYPKIPNTTYSSCGENCTYTKGFSCFTLTRPYGEPKEFAECDTESTNMCMGTIGVSNNCKTLECCQELNKQVMPNLAITFNSFNYIMKFRNEFGYEIPCDEFDSNTGDTCVQFADYGSSSDTTACFELEDFFNSVDDMYFDLF